MLPFRLDVSKAAEVEALGAATLARFGAPHLVFNNAGVGAGGLIWEHTLKDWEWVIGVNLMGVAHGVRVFTPMMLAAAEADSGYEGHIVNTPRRWPGLLNAPNMGAYNVSKHAVVSLSETLYQDLRLVTTQVSASVLCPFFVPTGITASERNRPAEMREAAQPTRSQLIGQAMATKAVGQRQGQRRRRGGFHRRCGARRPLLHLQPPEGAGDGADAAGRHHAAAQSDRPVRPQAGDRCLRWRAALRAAG